MTSSLPFKASGNTNPFDDWFFDEKGTGEVFELESDSDECVEPESMTDKDEN